MLRRRPVALLGGTSALVLCVLASAMQSLERRANPPLDSFANAAWLVFCSMTASGFGDVAPVTHAGRLVSAAATLWGLLTASLVLRSAMRLAELSKSEVRFAHRSRAVAGGGPGAQCARAQRRTELESRAVRWQRWRWWQRWQR